MVNGTVIRHPNLPRTITIYAQLANHSGGQPAHMIWPHLASPLCYLPSRCTGLLLNSSKHYTSLNLRAFALFLFVQYFPPLLLTLIYPLVSVSSQISPLWRPQFISKTRVIYLLLYTPLYFFHNTTTNVALHILAHFMINIHQPHYIRSSFTGLDHHYTIGV